ncbi:MAG: phenylacetate--CoA ligase family protein [Burkholderiales bacterium]
MTSLPLYRDALDWNAFAIKYPAPDIFEQTVYQWSPEQIRANQNTRFLEALSIAWNNGFYRQLWGKAGIRAGDIRSLDDILKLPTFTSDDIKADQEAHPPYGLIHGDVKHTATVSPLKLQSSGGTTGKPRLTLNGPLEWELNALTRARAYYVCGARPGDVAQITFTNSLANAAWCNYKACHDYLGIIPLTTGSGTVTSSRRQLEIAFDCGTNIWASRPEYLTRLEQVCRDELKRDIRELRTKFITSGLGPDLNGSLRRRIEEAWGCPVYDRYGTNEMGVGAFECTYQEGMHVMEDVNYFEILDVESGKPVPDGAPGNLVATLLYRQVMPLIRYNIRDLVRIKSTAQCACGSHFRRLDHLLGRSDTMVKLRGVNVYPQACQPAVVSDSRATGQWLCIVDRSKDQLRDEMLVKVEVKRDAPDTAGLKEHIEQRLHADLGVRIAVELVADGALDDYWRDSKPKLLIDRRFEDQAIDDKTSGK